MSILIKNIQSLVQILDSSVVKVSGEDMAALEQIENAFILIEEDTIKDFGSMASLSHDVQANEVIDATGRIVMPALVDSHTHLVFAKSREEEFVDKIKGLSYAEIAKKGGGILNSAKVLQNTSEEVLFEQALGRADEIIKMGTGTVEIKSGYGLTTADELKMLRVARRIGEETPLTVKTTFLGAHAVPKDTSKEAYLDKVINEMIPAVAAEDLADYCDVFCEEGFFSVEESRKVLEAGLKHGLKPKIHANQLHVSGGVQLGASLNAISVDHLESMGQAEVEALQEVDTMATMLPGAAFFLNMSFPPAREMIKAGLAVALATDFNPGSSPTGSMALMMSLACIKMKMLPEEAIHAATINGAYALEMSDQVGSITKGKKANLLITNPISSYSFIPYNFGHNVVSKMVLNGKVV